MKLAYIFAFTALFLNPSVEDKPQASDSTPEKLAPTASVPEVVPVGPAAEVPVEAAQPVPVVPDLPADMRVVVNGKGGVKQLTVVHQGHLVALHSGETSVLGDNSATIPLKGDSAITWESADRKTYEMLRGTVSWEQIEGTNSKGTNLKPHLRATARAIPTREISSTRHDCRAYEGESEVVTVLCRIDSLAVGAARTLSPKAQEGITMAEVGERRYFRMELDPNKNEIDAVVIGYSDGARGHVIRAEISKLPGETKAAFSFLAASRAQPIPVIRRFHHHRHFEMEF